MLSRFEIPHQIEVPGNCMLETAQWGVSGTKKGSSVHVRRGRTVIYNRSMSFILPPELKKVVRQALQFKRRVEIPLLDIRTWHKQGLTLRRYDWGSSGRISSAALALIGVMGIVATIMIAGKRCKKVKPSAGAKVTHSGKVNIKSEELTDAELASLAV